MPMSSIADHKRFILRAAFIIALVSAGCATQQVRPSAVPPGPPPVPAGAGQESAPEEMSPDVKAEDYVVPAPDTAAEEPVPALAAMAEETVSAPDTAAEETVPALDAMAEETVSTPDAAAAEPVPASDAMAAETVIAPHEKEGKPVPSFRAKIDAPAPAHAPKEAVRHQAGVRHSPVAEKKPARPAPIPAPSAAAPAEQKLEKTIHAHRKRLDERDNEVVSMPRGHSHRTLAERNDEQLLYVFTGMHKSTVEKIMGGRYYYKREYWKDPDGQIHEVLFYLTREPKKGTRVTERHLTPVIIKDSMVSAMGKYRLRKLRRDAKRTYAPTTAAR